MIIFLLEMSVIAISFGVPEITVRVAMAMLLRPARLLANKSTTAPTLLSTRLPAAPALWSRSFCATSFDDQIKATISKSKVVIFSKSYCPFCKRTKALFDRKGVEYTVMELDQVPGGTQLQAALTAHSGQRTVPNVFVSGKHLGGNDDTQHAARSGALDEMLA